MIWSLGEGGKSYYQYLQTCLAPSIEHAEWGHCNCDHCGGPDATSSKLDRQCSLPSLPPSSCTMDESQLCLNIVANLLGFKVVVSKFLRISAAADEWVTLITKSNHSSSAAEETNKRTWQKAFGFSTEHPDEERGGGDRCIDSGAVHYNCDWETSTPGGTSCDCLQTVDPYTKWRVSPDNGNLVTHAHPMNL